MREMGRDDECRRGRGRDVGRARRCCVSHVSQAEGPQAGKRRRALVPAAVGGGLPYPSLTVVWLTVTQGLDDNISGDNCNLWR